MSCKKIYWLVPLIFCISCSSYKKQVAVRSEPCQKLLDELKYRIITNNSGGYTFRFEHPMSATRPERRTVRQAEFYNFNINVLKNELLYKCGITYDLLSSTIGKENKRYYQTFDYDKCLIAVYSFDFGLNCGGNRCPRYSSVCNEIYFIFKPNGELIKCLFDGYELDIEPLSCPPDDE